MRYVRQTSTNSVRKNLSAGDTHIVETLRLLAYRWARRTSMAHNHAATVFGRSLHLLATDVAKIRQAAYDLCDVERRDHGSAADAKTDDQTTDAHLSE